MKSRLPFLAASFLALFVLLAAPPAGAEMTLDLLSTYDTGLDEGASEIVAYDPVSQRMFTVNATAATVDVIDFSDPARRGSGDCLFHRILT